jgi:hypothetical protein
VVEVHFHTGLQNLYQRAARWLLPATQVQIVISVKIYKRINGQIAMVAIRWERGAANPNYCVSFGTRALHPLSIASINGRGGPPLVGVGIGGAAACNALGIAAYQFRLPTALIFAGSAAPGGAPVFYTIDLFPIQQAIGRRYDE